MYSLICSHARTCVDRMLIERAFQIVRDKLYLRQCNVSLVLALKIQHKALKQTNSFQCEMSKSVVIPYPRVTIEKQKWKERREIRGENEKRDRKPRKQDRIHGSRCSEIPLKEG